MKKVKKKKIFIMGLTTFLLFTGGIAQAAPSYQNYNEIVGKFNGSAYTDYQTMKYGGQETIEIYSDSVGSDYTVDIRAIRDGYNSSWIRGVGDNQGYTIQTVYLLDSGTQHQLQFSNNIFTPVDVQVTGKWRNG